MTNDELQALCRVWQERLRLRDWIIDARLARRPEFGNTTQVGRCAWNENHRAARVSVLDPLDADLSNTTTPDNDPELILVHELLHIHFIPFVAQDNTPEDTAQEQAINCIAGALVSLARSAA